MGRSNICFWDDWPDVVTADEVATCHHPEGTGICEFCDLKRQEMKQHFCQHFDPVRKESGRVEEEVRQWLEYTEPKQERSLN